MPRDATARGERNIELIARDASRATVCEETLAHLATLLIGCLHSRDGPSARRGRKVRAAGASLDLLWRGLRWKSLPLLLWGALYGCRLLLLWPSALYGCRLLWPSALHGCRPLRLSALHSCGSTRGRTWRWRPSHLPGSGRSGPRGGTCRRLRGPGGRGGPRCRTRRRLSGGLVVGPLRQRSLVDLRCAEKRKSERCGEYWLQHAMHMSSFGVRAFPAHEANVSAAWKFRMSFGAADEPEGPEVAVSDRMVALDRGAGAQPEGRRRPKGQTGREIRRVTATEAPTANRKPASESTHKGARRLASFAFAGDARIPHGAAGKSILFHATADRDSNSREGSVACRRPGAPHPIVRPVAIGVVRRSDRLPGRVRVRRCRRHRGLAATRRYQSRRLSAGLARASATGYRSAVSSRLDRSARDKSNCVAAAYV
jgi:hypothetical protein